MYSYSGLSMVGPIDAIGSAVCDGAAKFFVCVCGVS